MSDDLMPAPPLVDDHADPDTFGEQLEAAKVAAELDAETGESIYRLQLTDGRRFDAHYEQWSASFVRRARPLLAARGIHDTPLALLRTALALRFDVDLDILEALAVLAVAETGGDTDQVPELRYPLIDWQETGHTRVVTDPSI